MSKRLLDYDPLTGVETSFTWNDPEQTFTISEKQDVGAVVEANKEAFNSIDAKAGWQGEWHRVASIPLTVYFELKQSGTLDDQKKMKAWLNDPDHRYFRTRPGRV